MYAESVEIYVNLKKFILKCKFLIVGVFDARNAENCKTKEINTMFQVSLSYPRKHFFEGYL